MKKDYSLIDIRLIELRSYYLTKIIISMIISFCCFSFTYLVFSLPAFYDIFYREYFFETFNLIYFVEENIKTIINVFLLFIALLTTILIVLIEYFVFNKKYQKYYNSFIFDELQLIDYSINTNKFNLNIKTMDSIYTANNIVMEINEHICSIKKKGNLDIFQITTKGKIKHSSLYVFSSNKCLNEFIQLDTLENHKINNFNGKNVFDFYYDSPKYPNKINVFSTYGKKTNSICSNELISLVNRLQIYFDSKITITAFENYLAIYVPNQRIKLSQSLIKKYKHNLIDKKVSTIDYIFKSLDDIYDQIHGKEE